MSEIVKSMEGGYDPLKIQDPQALMNRSLMHQQPVARPDQLRTIISTVEVKKAQKSKRNWLMALVDRARCPQKDKDDT
jgi:hypothetical protein